MSKTAKPETLGIPELAAALADANDLTKARAKAMVDALRDDIVQNLLAGKRVNLFGLGTFEVRDTKAKVGRNPKTGDEVPISPRRVLTFRPSHLMKDRVAGGDK